MSNSRHLHQQRRVKVVIDRLIWMFLILFTTSCNRLSTTTVKINPSHTITPEITAPKASTSTPTKVTTLTRTFWPTRTRTPTNSPRPPTETPLPCPPFNLDTTLPDPDIPENYIGRHYDTANLPKGLEWMGFVVLGEEHKYSLTHLSWKQERILYWLEKIICYDQKGHAYLEIIDAIASPPVKISEPPWYTGSDAITGWCFQDDEEISHIIAIGTYNRSSPVIDLGNGIGWQYTEVNFAFLIDTKQWKFVQLETKNLRCYEDASAGYPGP